MYPCDPYWRCKYKFGVLEQDGSIAFYRFLDELELTYYHIWLDLPKPAEESAPNTSDLFEIMDDYMTTPEE